MHCPHPQHTDEFDSVELVMYHLLSHIIELENSMTAAIDNQGELDKKVADLKAAIDADHAELKTAIDGLKAQIASGTPATALDFTGLDSLTTATQASVAADAIAAPVAPPVSTPAAAPADTTSVPATPAATDINGNPVVVNPTS